MATNLFATKTGLRQPEPPKSEGRAMYVLGSGPGGGDGMTFTTGSEVYEWTSNQLPGPKQPSGILGAWVDAAGIESGKNLIVQTPTQTFQFAGGTQGYVPITSSMPFSLKVSTSGSGTGTANVTLYNYNPLFTGSVATAPGGSGSSGSPGSSGYSGSGAGGNQGGGGNRPEL
jgi:hypothetical protein